METEPGKEGVPEADRRENVPRKEKVSLMRTWVFGMSLVTEQDGTGGRKRPFLATLARSPVRTEPGVSSFQAADCPLTDGTLVLCPPTDRTDL